MAKITDKLDNINRTLEKMLKILDKREPPFIRLLIIGGLIAAFLSIMDRIETFIKWLKEGLW